jgi:hypothetical protein
MTEIDSQLEVGKHIDVPKVASDEQVASFVEDGFLVMPGLVDETDVQALCDDMIKLARGGYPSNSLKPLPKDTSDDEALRQILCIHQPHYISPVINQYVTDARIAGVLSQITAAHLPHWDGSVMCMQSMMFVKPPGFQGQPWHQDEIYIPTRDRSLLGAWIALDDATVENGCLWVVPGSHRSGFLWPQQPNTNTEEFDFSQESYGFDESAEVPVEVKRGSVVFFNGYLLHRSRKNRSDIYRRVLVNHYLNAWSRLPWWLKEGETAATANARGGMVPVSGVDPYAWQGNLESGGDVFLRQCKANTPEKDDDS